MADIERTVNDLTIRVRESPSDRKLRMVITFSVRVGPGPTGIDNYTIILPGLIDRRVDRLLSEIRKVLADEDVVIRDLVVDKDFTIRLQS